MSYNPRNDAQQLLQLEAQDHGLRVEEYLRQWNQGAAQADATWHERKRSDYHVYNERLFVDTTHGLDEAFPRMEDKEDK